MSVSIGKRSLAEFFGTFWLVLGGCGSAIFAANFGGDGNPLGLGFLGVSLAFGLTVLTMAFAIGHISGCHLNPAVSVGLMMGGRFSAKDLVPYIIAQTVGAIAAALLLHFIVSQGAGYDAGAQTLAANGFGEHSPGGYGMVAVIITEIVMTAFFLIIILGATDGRAPAGFAGIPIGLALALIHFISIPVSNTSVNPARSTGPALIDTVVGNGGSGWALAQLWVFWVAPIVGAILGAIIYRAFSAEVRD